MSDGQEDSTSTFLRDVGRRLQEARKRADLSLQDAADHLGLKRAAVGHWETGKNPIDIRKLSKLAALYETSIVALIADKLTNEDILELTKRQLNEASQSKEPAANPDAEPRKDPRRAA